MNAVNLILQGVLLGGYYALLAGGLAFMFGVMRIVNLAHGSLAIGAAYLVWVAADRLQINPLLATILLLPVMASIGWVLYRVVFAPSLKGGALLPILSTFGLATVLDNGLFQLFGADTRSLAPYVDSLAYDSWTLPLDLSVGQLAVGVFVLAVVVLGALHAFLTRTATGRQIRAASEDADAAELVGVNVRRVYGIATAISMMMVGLAGVSLALRATFDPYTSSQQLIFAFEAVVIGGPGSVWRTLAGGIVLGVAQNLGASQNPQGFLIAGHLTFLVILLARIYARGWFASAQRWLVARAT